MECRSCKHCMFYVARPNGLVGRCRRHAPTMQGWPVMKPDSWCGDYKLNETTLPRYYYTMQGKAVMESRAEITDRLGTGSSWGV